MSSNYHILSVTFIVCSFILFLELTALLRLNNADLQLLILFGRQHHIFVTNFCVGDFNIYDRLDGGGNQTAI